MPTSNRTRNSVEIEPLAKNKICGLLRWLDVQNRLQNNQIAEPKQVKLFHKSPKYGEKFKPKFDVQTGSEKSRFEGFGRVKSKLAGLYRTTAGIRSCYYDIAMPRHRSRRLSATFLNFLLNVTVYLISILLPVTIQSFNISNTRLAGHIKI